MRWKVHGRRTMYESDWVNVYLDDVELPDATHIDHHVLEMPKASQTAIVLDDSRNVLLIWRHRFITDRWGWEVPAGWVEPGEGKEQSILREILEETGYESLQAQPIAEYDAIPGISSMHFTVWLCSDVTQTTEPENLESSVVKWHSVDEVRQLVLDDLISDGPSLTALSFFLAFLLPLHQARTDDGSASS